MPKHDVRFRAGTIDGEFYIRADDVVALLEELGRQEPKSTRDRLHSAAKDLRSMIFEMYDSKNEGEDHEPPFFLKKTG